MTEQAKHTEGPWELVEPMQHQGKWNIERWLVTTGTGQIIAKVGHVEVSASQANARLIAAAPDLLEAAKRAVVRFASTGGGLWSVEDRYTVAALRSAIAKAEGTDLHAAAE